MIYNMHVITVRSKSKWMSWYYIICWYGPIPPTSLKGMALTFMIHMKLSNLQNFHLSDNDNILTTLPCSIEIITHVVKVIRDIYIGNASSQVLYEKMKDQHFFPAVQGMVEYVCLTPYLLAELLVWEPKLHDPLKNGWDLIFCGVHSMLK